MGSTYPSAHQQAPSTMACLYGRGAQCCWGKFTNTCASHASWHPVCHTVPLTCWVVCSSGAVVVTAIVVRGCCSSFDGRWGAFWVFIVVGRLQSFIGQTYVGCWPSFAGHCPLWVRLSSVGQLLSCWAARVVCDGVGCVMWHSGNMEGAHCN